MRADPGTAGLPVLICTGLPEALRGSPGRLAALADAVLDKPFDIDELATEARRLAARGPAAAAPEKLPRAQSREPAPSHRLSRALVPRLPKL